MTKPPLDITMSSCIVLPLPFVTTLFSLTFSTTLTYCLSILSYCMLQFSHCTLDISNSSLVISGIGVIIRIITSERLQLQLQLLPTLTHFTGLFHLPTCILTHLQFHSFKFRIINEDLRLTQIVPCNF